jgi:predicted DNA-binding transcriptional regulator YafY
MASTLTSEKAVALIESLVGDKRPVRIIRTAAEQGNRVVIKYRKESGEVVSREIRPYQESDRLFFATDTIHGAGNIHSFRKDRILDAKLLGNSWYKPHWPVRFESFREDDG